MNVEVRGDSVVISGYVNAIERYSKPITSTLRNKVQTFVEKIKAGVFKTALKRNEDVKVLLNHDWNRELANTKDVSAKLEEDNIGLRAEVIITDAEVVEKARQNKLVGWSFGFYANTDEVRAEGESTKRTVTDMDLLEVSILDDTKRPAYYGTSIEARCEGGRMMEIREEVLNEEVEKTEVQEEKREQSIDYDKMAEIVAEKVVAMLEERKAEETKEEVQEETTEEETAETEETETEEVEETTEEEEQRAVDYTSFEERLNALN